jgi:hypothetical protein
VARDYGLSAVRSQYRYHGGRDLLRQDRPGSPVLYFFEDLSVIFEMVSFEIGAPGGTTRWRGKISAKGELISPVVNPLAYNDKTISSTPFDRRWRFLAICGSNIPSRSRGISIGT